MRTGDCDKKFSFGSQVCVRTPDHLGLHRDAKSVRRASVQWGDNECKTEEK